MSNIWESGFDKNIYRTEQGQELPKEEKVQTSSILPGPIDLGKIQLLPDSETGFVAFDDNLSEIFKIISGGTDVGDVIIGDSSGQHAKWDKSAGTFAVTGTITATAGSIGGWSISDVAIYYDGATDALSSGMAPADYPFYAGKKYADRATALFRVEPSGKLTCSDIVATGVINAQSGYLSAGVYVDTSDGIVCESGGLNVGVAGHIRGGQTDYNTGTGFFLGYSTDAYKLSLGNPSDTSKLLLWDGTDLIVNDSPITLYPFYGDGSDGDTTISSNTTLTADKFYNNLTIDSGYTLNTGGYRVYVKGTLTNNGTISNNGGNGGNGSDGDDGGSSPGADGSGGAGGSGGSAAGTGYYATTADGKAGGAGGDKGGVGTAGTAANVNTTNSYLSDNGKAGTTGGTGGNSGGAGGGGGAAGTTTQATYISKASVENQLGICFDNLGSLAKFSASGGSGGSGGGGGGQRVSPNASIGGGGGGAGSGAPGGIVFLSARKIINTGTMSANGGNGGIGGDGGNAWTKTSDSSGGGGGGAGGSGGNGGVLTLIYSTFTNTGTLTVAGGTGGTGGAAGSDAGGGAGSPSGGDNGTTGEDGLLIQLRA
jgi:hypothetical protein